MENEQINREIKEYPLLSIEEMLKLTDHVKNWRATKFLYYPCSVNDRFEPRIQVFQGDIEDINLELESSAADSFSQWYGLTTSSTRNILGYYKEKEKKCDKRLIELFSSLESRFIQRYYEKIKSDMDEVRRLLQ